MNKISQIINQGFIDYLVFLLIMKVVFHYKIWARLQFGWFCLVFSVCQNPIYLIFGGPQTLHISTTFANNSIFLNVEVSEANEGFSYAEMGCIHVYWEDLKSMKSVVERDQI